MFTNGVFFELNFKVPIEIRKSSLQPDYVCFMKEMALIKKHPINIRKITRPLKLANILSYYGLAKAITLEKQKGHKWTIFGSDLKLKRQEKRL